MASLTPGVLSKLLENKDARVTGEYRHALLQVIEIVPCFSNNTDPWQSSGYFLKLSDSLHSAYVSVPQNDVELISNDKLQLGQFVYVTRLDSATEKRSLVPVVRGLNPVPKRRPCIGNPIDLVSSESLHIGESAGLEFRKPKKKGNDKGGCRLKRDEEVCKLKLRKASPKSKTVEEGLEMRRLSLDSSRRVWEHNNPVAKTLSSRFKLKSASTSPNVIDKKISLKVDSPLKPPTSTISPLKSKNENLCPKSTSTSPRKSTSKSPPCAGTVPGQLLTVPLNCKTWYDTSTTSWEDLPPPMCSLGKKVVTHRNVAALAAVRALEEASAADIVIQCMCMFAELCQSYGTLSAEILVNQFLELHLCLQRIKLTFYSLLTPSTETKPSSYSTTLRCLAEGTCKFPTRKNAMSWVQVAVGTNLSKFNLFRTQAKCEVLNGEKCHYVVIENSREEMNTENSSAQNKQNRVTQACLSSNSTSKRLVSSKQNLTVAKNKDINNQDQSKENELKVIASLAEKLLEASREWFLKYLEESLDNGFGLKSEEGSTEIACLLGQLKKVDHWLDNLVGDDKVDHRVENLRKSLYRFLLDHVNSAVASS